MASAVQIDRSLKVTPIRPISPGLKSWIKNCVVPILVQEYLAIHEIEVVTERDKVVERDSNTPTAARMGE
jgi:hypothetical protein